MSASEPASYHGPPPCLGRPAVRTRAAWRTQDLRDECAEMRVVALLEWTETTIQASGAEVTIRTLWLHLADRCVGVDDPDLKAAAALTGLAVVSG